MRSIRILLDGIVDYAGLFPPAGLDMATAVRNYADYVTGEHNWMLGRFVVPVARLAEFEEAAAGAVREGGRAPWRLSALAGTDPETDAGVLARFNDRLAGAVVIDAVEARASSTADLIALREAMPQDVDVYVELAVDDDLDGLLRAVADAGARAKIRTGGVTPDAIPSPPAVARFIDRCRFHGSAFKATAGLHHPLRSLQRLTYKPDSVSSIMHGFLNVFCAAALAREEAGADEIEMLLDERSPAALNFTDDGVVWRQHTFDNEALRRMRSGFAISFGSCSFEEPVADLKGLKLL